MEINVGVPTYLKSKMEFTSHLYHPYGMEEFRDKIRDFVKEKKDEKGLVWTGYDLLTHAWRTPWDTHVRYPELLSPLVEMVHTIVSQMQSEVQWYLHDSWVATYTNGSGAAMHAHNNGLSGWAFCYYVDVPDTGPPFTFCDDIDGMVDVNVSSGDLLIFSDMLKHQVYPNMQGDRVIISGNFKARSRSAEVEALWGNETKDFDADDWTNEFLAF